MTVDHPIVFSIIVPAYNEEGNIKRTVAELCRAFDRLPYPFEIIIVNDGSTDRTLEASNGLREAFKMMTVVSLPDNCGKGYAIRKGVEKAVGQYVVFMDADLDIQPDRINQVLEMLQSGSCDIAIGSKRHPESELVYPLFRKIISVLYYGIVQLLFGLNVRDTQAGYKIFKRQALLSILPRILVKKFAFDLEILVAARRLGYRIREFPIRVNQSGKYGGISAGDIWRTGIDTLAVFYRNRFLDFYGGTFPPDRLQPNVSVIIPVGRAGENIERCLTECLNQDYGNFEIIVLPDSNAHLLSKYNQHPRIRIMPTGSVNPSVKRNIGASAANGEILAFIDDDAFPFHNWLGTGIRHFQDSGVAAAGGPGVTPAGSPPPEKVSGYIFASPAVSGRYRSRYVPYKYQEVDDLPSCNLFVSAAVFKDIGGFASGHWPGEDTLLCRAIALKTGKKIVYDPFLMVEHRRRAVFQKHLVQVAGYALHRGYFAKRWPENSCKPAYFIPSLATAWIALGWPVCFFAPLQLLYPASLLFYLAVCFLFSIQLSGLKDSLMTFAGTILTHLTYGTMFLAGFLRLNLGEHKPAASDAAPCLVRDEVDIA